MELKDWCELAKALVTIGTLIFMSSSVPSSTIGFRDPRV